MKCKVCGYNIPDDKMYCPLCGTPKNSAPEVARVSAAKEAKEAKVVKTEVPVQDELTKAFAEAVSKEKNAPSKPQAKVVSLKNNGFDVEPIETKPRMQKVEKVAEPVDSQKREHRTVSEAFKYEPKPAAANAPVASGPVREHRSVGEALKDLKKPENVITESENDYVYNMFVKIPRRDADRAAANRQSAARKNQTPIIKFPAEQVIPEAPEDQEKQDIINTLRYDHNFNKVETKAPDWQNRPLPMPANQDITMRYPAYQAPDDLPADDFDRKNIAPQQPIETPSVSNIKPAFAGSFENKLDEKRPEKFNTFVAKNEEFQTLLNQEYERIKNLHKDEPQDDPEVLTIDEILHPDTEKKVEASKLETNVSAIAPSKEEVAKLQDALEKIEPIGKHSAVSRASQKDEKEDYVAEVSTAMGANAFKRNTVEMKIAEMKRNEQAEARFREERKKRLAEMEAARKAYFDEQDQLHPEYAPKFDKRDTFESFDPLPKSPIDNVVIVEERQTAEMEPVEPEEAVTATKQFDPVLEKPKYANQEPEYTFLEDEDKVGVGKYLLRFFLLFILALCACELVIRFMDFFLPNLAATKTVLDIEQAVLDALRSLLN